MGAGGAKLAAAEADARQLNLRDAWGAFADEEESRAYRMPPN